MFFDAYCQIATISLHQKLKRTKICQPQNSSFSAIAFPKSLPQTATSPKRPPASAAAFPVTPSPSSPNSALKWPNLPHAFSVVFFDNCSQQYAPQNSGAYVYKPGSKSRSSKSLSNGFESFE